MSTTSQLYYLSQKVAFMHINMPKLHNTGENLLMTDVM